MVSISEQPWPGSTAALSKGKFLVLKEKQLFKSGEKEMKTYLAKPGEIERKHVVVDATGIPLGRLAVKIANALRGKDRPTYTPHVDTG